MNGSRHLRFVAIVAVSTGLGVVLGAFLVRSREASGVGERAGNQSSTAKAVAEPKEALERQRASERKSDARAPRRITNRFGMEFVEIPPGRFLMGAARFEPAPGRSLPEHARVEPDAQPMHIVYITRPFFLGVTEVTELQRILVEIAAGKIDPEEYGIPFASAEDYRAYVTKHRKEQAADTFASWEEANEFVRTLSRLDPDYDYRMPTEAEWEYACRGQVDCIDFHRKDVEVVQPLGKYGVFDAVRAAAPNGFGLYDMLRNAGEFCSDWYSRDYYWHSPLANPTGPPTGVAKVARGVRSEGGGRYAAWRRYPVDPGGDSNILLGVRLVLEPEGHVHP